MLLAVKLLPTNPWNIYIYILFEEHSHPNPNSKHIISIRLRLFVHSGLENCPSNRQQTSTFDLAIQQSINNLYVMPIGSKKKGPKIFIYLCMYTNFVQKIPPLGGRRYSLLVACGAPSGTRNSYCMYVYFGIKQQKGACFVNKCLNNIIRHYVWAYNSIASNQQ